MDHKPENVTAHVYHGTREEADKLIAWLMDKTYWAEVSCTSDKFQVRCGCGPDEVRKARIKIAKPKD